MIDLPKLEVEIVKEEFKPLSKDEISRLSL